MGVAAAKWGACVRSCSASDARTCTSQLAGLCDMHDLVQAWVGHIPLHAYMACLDLQGKNCKQPPLPGQCGRAKHAELSIITNLRVIPIAVCCSIVELLGLTGRYMSNLLVITELATSARVLLVSRQVKGRVKGQESLNHLAICS